MCNTFTGNVKKLRTTHLFTKIMKYSIPKCYANTALSSQVLRYKHYSNVLDV